MMPAKPPNLPYSARKPGEWSNRSTQGPEPMDWPHSPVYKKLTNPDIPRVRARTSRKILARAYNCKKSPCPEFSESIRARTFPKTR